MDTQDHPPPDKPSDRDESPLPVAKPMTAQPEVQATAPSIPAPPQGELAAQPAQQQPQQEATDILKPLLVRIVEDDELSSFERKTIRYGALGILVAFLALVAACVTGYFIYQQFAAMEEANTLADYVAKKARLDSAASSIATAKQMNGLQAQIIAAQEATKALQGQLVESRRSANIAALQLELTDRPWIKIEKVMPRGNGPEIPALSFQDINVTSPQVIKQQTYLNFEVHGRNVGHSTALSVKVIPELYLAQWKDGYSGKVKEEEARFCAQRERENENWSSAAQAVFQGDPFDFYGGNSGAISTDAMNFFSDIPGGPYILPVLIGCVDYQFQSSPVHHHVRFVYEIFHASDPRTRFFLAGQGVKADDLNFIRNPDDDYAD